MHQATQCPGPSRLWTPVDPTPYLQAPSTAAFHKLWPGEGEGCQEGGSWADPSDTLVSPCWCSRGPFNLLTPHTAATTTAFCCGYTHLLSTSPACTHGIWPTPLAICTHTCPLPCFLVYTCRFSVAKGSPRHYIASLLGGGARYHPILLVPGVLILPLGTSLTSWEHNPSTQSNNNSSPGRPRLPPSQCWLCPHWGFVP